MSFGVVAARNASACAVRALLLATAAIAITTPVVGAETRRATLTDGPDDAVAYDISEVRAQFARDEGRLTVTLALRRSVPEEAKSAGDYATVSARRCRTETDREVGDVEIRFARDPVAPDRFTGTARVAGRDRARPLPVEAEADGQELTVTLADALLANADLRCLEASGSGRSRDDGANQATPVDTVQSEYLMVLDSLDPRSRPFAFSYSVPVRQRLRPPRQPNLKGLGRCSTACEIHAKGFARLRGGRIVPMSRLRGSTFGGPEEQVPVFFRFSPGEYAEFLPLLRRGEVIRYKIVLTAVDGEGRRASVTRRVTLLPPRERRLPDRTRARLS